MAIAAVFPGQGSQRPGMGRDFYEQVNASREVYEEASETLGWDVAELCFSENPLLNMTEYAQPCILTTEIAILRSLASLFGFTPEIFAGHSLGEYTALVAAGVLPLADVLRLVHIRGRLMQEAVPPGVGGMAAFVGTNIDLDRVENCLEGLPMDIANINSPNQIVISGEIGAMEDARSNLVEAFGENNFRFIRLNVSAPFHSRFMCPVEDSFEDSLSSARSKLRSELTKKVTSNYTGAFHSDDALEIENSLVAQLSSTVRWSDNMQVVKSCAESVYEIGPSRPLREFFKTVGVDCASVTSFSAAVRLFGEEGSHLN
jgi:[acyl-carrier-protein] S-malonyltransferase